MSELNRRDHFMWKFCKFFIPAAGLFCAGSAIYQFNHGYPGTGIMDLGLAALNFWLAKKYWF